MLNKIKIIKFGLLILFFQLLFQCSSLDFLLKRKVTIPAQEINIIPKPVNIEYGSGNFVFEDKITVKYSPRTNLEHEANYLAAKINNLFPEEIATVNNSFTFFSQGKEIALNISAAEIFNTHGSYKLAITQNKISIKAKNPSGIFYGIQTLLQIMPPRVYQSRQVMPLQKLTLPAIEIYDSPRFKYRGMHLDLCGHFFSVDYIKRYIDYLAYHKINILHLTLSDKKIWRLESKSYPELTPERRKYDAKSIKVTPLNQPHKIYSQQDINKIIKYTRQNHIEIVPEFDISSLANDEFQAYSDHLFDFETEWQRLQNKRHAEQDSNYIFLKSLLDEISTLIPSDYIHLTGLSTLQSNPDTVSIFNRSEQFERNRTLQRNYVEMLKELLDKNGQQLILEDNLIESGILPNTVILSDESKTGRFAARNNQKVVAAYQNYLKFDEYPDHNNKLKMTNDYRISLESLYDFAPTANLDKQAAKYILGVEAILNTDYIRNHKELEYLLLPRLSALSELAWTMEKKRNWYDFSHRMRKQYENYLAMDLNFRVPPPKVEKQIVLDKPDSINIESPISSGTIRYTIDGTDPNAHSAVYSQPIYFDHHTTLKSALFLPNGQKSKTITTSIIITSSKNERNIGLRFKYFEENFSSFEEIDETVPDFTGSTQSLDVGSLKRRSDNFTIQFQGYLHINTPGKYTFYLTSNDGSQLIIKDSLVVETPTYINQPVTGSITLEVGQHPVIINYEDRQGNENLELEYSGPGINRQKISPWLFNF